MAFYNTTAQSATFIDTYYLSKALFNSEIANFYTIGMTDSLLD